MTEFREQDLSGARFDRVHLRGATVARVQLIDASVTVPGERQAMVRHAMALTDAQLASDVTCTEPGWPQAETFPFKACLRIVINEEWEHGLYAERDLTALEKEN